MGIRAVLAGGDVVTERLGGSPDGIREAAVGSPVAHRQGFEDRVERRPVEAWGRLRGVRRRCRRRGCREACDRRAGSRTDQPFVTDPLT